MYGPASNTNPSFSNADASPPALGRASMTRTLNPCCASRSAAVNPRIPARIMTTRRIIFDGAIPAGSVFRSALTAMAHSRDGVTEMLRGPFREQRAHPDHYRVHKLAAPQNLAWLRIHCDTGCAN